MFNKILRKTKVSPQEFLKDLLNKTFFEEKINQKFEDSDIDINWQNKENQSFLHLCCLNNLTESINWLIKKGINLELEDLNKETALFYAVKANSFAIVNTLIEKNVNVDHKNRYNRSAFQEAIYSNNTGIVDLLMKHTYNINNTDIYGHNVMFDAVANGDLNLVSKVASLEDIDINQVDKDGDSILHKKNVLKNTDIAMTLLDSGADPTIKDKTGKNFLFYAATHETDANRLIDKALDNGADIRSKSSDNSTVIMEVLLAFSKLSPEELERRQSLMYMLRRLIHEGVDLNSDNDLNETALTLAAKQKDLETISLLIEEGAEVNFQTKNGETVLSRIVLEGHDYLDTILVLVNNKADINLKDFKNRSIVEKLVDIILYLQNDKELNDIELEDKLNRDGQYMILLKELLLTSKVDLKGLTSKGKPLFFDPILYKNDNLYKLFKEYKMDINLKDNNENNILNVLMADAQEKYNFSKKEYLNTLKGLIASGIDVNSKDKHGATSLHNAVLNSCEQTLKLFLDAKGDIKAQDKKGRSLVHNCVWGSKVGHFGVIHGYNPDIVNKVDKFGILPINYASFMGQKDLVIKLLDSGAYINNPNRKDKNMIKFLSQFFKNLDTLPNDDDSELNKKNIRMLVANMKEEFNLKES